MQIEIIEWLVQKLFWWKPLREAIFAEVHMYDRLDEIMNDPDAMKIAASYFPDFDGTRGWAYDEDRNKYYFNDIPEESFSEAFKQLDLMQNPSQPEYKTDEMW